MGHEKLLTTAAKLATYNPEFFSCTYGAGGSTRDRTLTTVLQLDGEIKVPTAPPTYPVLATAKKIYANCCICIKKPVLNALLPLRGDLPSGMGGMANGELRYANELVEFIRNETGDHFYIEVAAYPEMHPQARDFEVDLQNLLEKCTPDPTVRSPNTSLMPIVTSILLSERVS